MNKKLIFAALAAMTLSLGFTACDDDDDNVDNNKHSEVYRLKVDNESNDEQSVSAIYNAYMKAINHTDQAAADTVLVTGKDNADCAKKFAEMMVNAENTLSSKTFDGITVVNAIDIDGNSVYGKVYGAQENGWFSPTYRADMFYERGDVDTKYVTSFEIERYSNWGSYTFYSDNSDDRYLSYDFCQGTGADYIQIAAYPVNETFKSKVHDVLIYVCQDNEQAPEQFNFENRTYVIAKGDVGTSANNETIMAPISLNEGVANAKKLYLYYTHYSLNGKDRNLLIEGLARCSAYKGVWPGRTFIDCSVSDNFDNDTAPKAYPKDQYTYEFVKGVGKDASGKIVILYPYGVDCNLGSTSSSAWHLYLRAVYENY